MSGADLGGLVGWQRELLDRWTAGERDLVEYPQRRSMAGKTTVMLRILRAERDAGRHVHVARRDGTWCVKGEADGCTLPACDGVL